MLIVLKSGSLELLEPSGPVQVCNGIALPLPRKEYTCDVLLEDESGIVCGDGSAGGIL